MSSYLVIGASGALGSKVLPVLASSTEVDRLIGIDRRPLSVSSPKLSFIHDDLEQCDLAALLDGVDVVVQLATSMKSPLVRKLLETAENVGVKQVVMVSSAIVFGAWAANPVPLTEDAPLRPNPGFEQATRLAELERVATEWRSTESRCRIAVLRMAMMLGGGAEGALTTALGGVDAHREASTSRPVQFLHIDDAVRAIVTAIERELDGTFNVSPSGLVGDAAARAVAGSAPRPGLPRQLAWLANDVMFRFKFRSSYSSVEPYLKNPWVISSDRLRAEGWKPAYTSEEALVAEARPTWWGGLRPGQRRSLVSSGVVAGVIGGGLVGAAVVALVARGRAVRSFGPSK